MDRIVDWLFGALLFVCFAVVAVVVYAIFTSVTSEKFSLVKAEWYCTAHETRRVSVMVGKVPMMQNRSVCVQYSARN